MTDGVQPRLVAEPATPEGLGAALAWATSEGLRVLAAGGRTKLEWGAASGPDRPAALHRRCSTGWSSTVTAT